MNKQEYINQCVNSKWANDWINGISNFFAKGGSGQIPASRKQQAKRHACRDRANNMNFPVSQRLSNYMLGGSEKQS